MLQAMALHGVESARGRRLSHPQILEETQKIAIGILHEKLAIPGEDVIASIPAVFQLQKERVARSKNGCVQM